MHFKDAKGNSVTWLWDYAQDRPRLQSEMTKEDIAASEKAKWEGVKDALPDKGKDAGHSNGF